MSVAFSGSSRGKSVVWFTRLALAWVALFASPTHVLAQAAAEPAGYQQLMDEAVSEYELRHFAEARALFARGASLYPNARAFRGLGMSEFELRDYTDAVASLERALAAQVKPLAGPLRSETEQLLERARRFVGRIVLTLEPAQTQVLVDDVPAPLDTPRDLLLEVGDHTLELRAEGYLSQRRTLKVRGGELESLHVTLAPVSVAVPSPPLAVTPAPLPAQRDEGSQPRPLYKNPWLWTGVGVAVAVLATGLAVGLAGGESSSPNRGELSGVITGP